MKTQEIINGTKILAEFDEWEIEKGMENSDDPFYVKGILGISLLSSMRYDESFDWIMSVVEKIKNLDIVDWVETYSQKGGIEIVSINTEFDEHDNPKFKMATTNLLESYFLICIEFITWYNAEHKPR